MLKCSLIRNSVEENIEVRLTFVFLCTSCPLDDAQSLPESNIKVVEKFVNFLNFAT